MLRALAFIILLAPIKSGAEEHENLALSNPDHFGCWSATQPLGIENQFELCISIGAVSYEVHLQKRVCNAEGSLAGFSEDGSRWYLIKPSACSDGGSMGAVLFECALKEGELRCLNIDMAVLATENRVEYTVSTVFKPDE